ncbi:MAG: response regulator [Muribaculaceae bacterium]
MDPIINPSDYTILIVDDNQTNIILLQAILKRAKYNTVSVTNGPDALQIMQEKQPDLVLLDIMMPDMDGYEVARRKDQIESIQSIPFLFVTALSDTNSMVKGFKAGCSDFITKPFNTEEILIRIHHQIINVENRRIINSKNEELKSLIRNRDKLYAVVAHDLRSPLGTIKSVLNILDENLNSEIIGFELYDLLHATTESADELFGLLENLLFWTRTQMGKLIFQPKEIKIYEAVTDAIKATSSMSNIHRISINYTDKTENATLLADKNMITTVIRNILANGIKFSDEDSSIEIETKIVDNQLSCSITDHGCGMDDEVKQALQQQISITTTGKHQEEGTGLGLTLCREFIRAHNGNLSFESEMNVGTTFTFTIPLGS